MHMLASPKTRRGRRDELCDAQIRTYGCMIATDRCISLGMHLRACWTSFAETLMDKRSLYGHSERGWSWPFTYLCYDSASLDLIDGIAINLRISRGRGLASEGEEDDGRTWGHLCVRNIFIRTYRSRAGRRTCVHAHLGSERIPMNTD